jgi:hypothetical protein
MAIEQNCSKKKKGDGYIFLAYCYKDMSNCATSSYQQAKHVI